MNERLDLGKHDLYLKLSHAMQSGVAQELELGSDQGTPKNLRVGVNQAMVQHAALVVLLVQKGVITYDEYFDELNDRMSEEVQAYEERLSERMGIRVHLA